jgi:transposase
VNYFSLIYTAKTSYSSDFKLAAVRLRSWLNDNELFYPNGRRANSDRLVEDMLDMHSHGKAVARWAHEVEETGAGPSESRRGGRREEHVKLADEMKSQLLEDLRKKPSLTSNQISDTLLSKEGVEVHPTTITKFLREHEPPWSRKKMSFQYNETTLNEVSDLLDLFTRDDIVLVAQDETSIHVGQGYTTGWAERGKRPIEKRGKFNRSEKLNISLMVTDHGMLDYTPRWGEKKHMGFNADDISTMVSSVFEKLPSEYVMVWDQASIHTCPQNRLHDVWAGREGPFLIPAYCPQFNPCEFANNSLKQKVNLLRPTTKDELKRAVLSAFQSISPEECSGFFDTARNRMTEWVFDYLDEHDN